MLKSRFNKHVEQEQQSLFFSIIIRKMYLRFVADPMGSSDTGLSLLVGGARLWSEAKFGGCRVEVRSGVWTQGLEA